MTDVRMTGRKLISEAFRQVVRSSPLRATSWTTLMQMRRTFESNIRRAGPPLSFRGVPVIFDDLLQGLAHD